MVKKLLTVIPRLLPTVTKLVTFVGHGGNSPGIAKFPQFWGRFSLDLNKLPKLGEGGRVFKKYPMISITKTCYCYNIKRFLIYTSPLPPSPFLIIIIDIIQLQINHRE